MTTYTKINKSASIFLGGNPKHSSSSESTQSKVSHSSTTIAARNQQNEAASKHPQNEGSRQVLTGWDDIPKGL